MKRDDVIFQTHPLVLESARPLEMQHRVPAASVARVSALSSPLLLAGLGRRAQDPLVEGEGKCWPSGAL